MPELPAVVWFAIILGALIVTTGEAIKDKVGPVLHKANCGIILVVGKHCEKEDDSEKTNTRTRSIR